MHLFLTYKSSIVKFCKNQLLGHEPTSREKLCCSPNCFDPLRLCTGFVRLLISVFRKRYGKLLFVITSIRLCPGLQAPRIGLWFVGCDQCAALHTVDGFEQTLLIGHNGCLALSCRCFSSGGPVNAEWSKCPGSKARNARDKQAKEQLSIARSESQ